MNIPLHRIKQILRKVTVFWLIKKSKFLPLGNVYPWKVRTLLIFNLTSAWCIWIFLGMHWFCRRKERRPRRLRLSPSRHCRLRRRHLSSLPRRKASRLWSCPCLSLSSFSRPSPALRASPTASLPPPRPETSQPARCRTTRCPCSWGWPSLPHTRPMGLPPTRLLWVAAPPHLPEVGTSLCFLGDGDRSARDQPELRRGMAPWGWAPVATLEIPICIQSTIPKKK